MTRLLPALLPFLLTFTAACGADEASARDPAADPEIAESGDAPSVDTTTLPLFVTPEQAQALITGGARIMDARSAERYGAGHLPEARHAPWQAFVAEEQSGALMPTAQIQSALRSRGISASQPVLIYGDWKAGWGEEGRLMWMLDHLGHPRLHILEGGFARWTASGGAATRTTPAAVEGDFTAQPQADRRISTDDLYTAITGPEAARPVVLDNRRAEEFNGATPYGSSRGGHVPGALHVYWKDLLTDEGLRPLATLTDLLGRLGISADREVVTYCTGGVRSGFAYAVLKAMKLPRVRNYDGSWWAWSQRADLPVE